MTGVSRGSLTWPLVRVAVTQMALSCLDGSCRPDSQDGD
jgi:hypothetical protein